MTNHPPFTLAWVELTRGQVSRVELNTDTLGGRGLGVELLRGNPDALMFLTGLLTDSAAPLGGRWCAAARQRDTGRVIAPTSGSAFGRMLKQAGWDGIVLVGEAPEWSLLCIDGGEIRLLSAAEYVGLRTDEATGRLKTRFGGSALTIGPAGENRSPLSAILCDGRRAFGRDGIGAVMGAKRLKALVIRSPGPIPAHACAECSLRCGHADAGSDSAFTALCNACGLDAVAAAKLLADIPERDIPEALARLSLSAAPAPKTAKSGRKTKIPPEAAAVIDSLGACLFAGPALLHSCAAALPNCTEDSLLQIGREICKLEETSQHSWLPL